MSESKVVKEFEHNGKMVEVKVSYNLGGVNWATSRTEKRGYYIHVQPFERKVRDGYTTRTVVGFSGVKMLLLEVGRKSEKSLQKAISMVDDAMINMLLMECRLN